MGGFFTVDGYSINMHCVTYINWNAGEPGDGVAHVYVSGRVDPIAVRAEPMCAIYREWCLESRRRGAVGEPDWERAEREWKRAERD